MNISCIRYDNSRSMKRNDGSKPFFPRMKSLFSNISLKASKIRSENKKKKKMVQMTSKFMSGFKGSLHLLKNKILKKKNIRLYYDTLLNKKSSRALYPNIDIDISRILIHWQREIPSFQKYDYGFINTKIIKYAIFCLKHETDKYLYFHNIVSIDDFLDNLKIYKKFSESIRKKFLNNNCLLNYFVRKDNKIPTSCAFKKIAINYCPITNMPNEHYIKLQKSMSNEQVAFIQIFFNTELFEEYSKARANHRRAYKPKYLTGLIFNFLIDSAVFRLPDYFFQSGNLDSYYIIIEEILVYLPFCNCFEKKKSESIPDFISGGKLISTDKLFPLCKKKVYHEVLQTYRWIGPIKEQRINGEILFKEKNKLFFIASGKYTMNEEEFCYVHSSDIMKFRIYRLKIKNIDKNNFINNKFYSMLIRPEEIYYDMTF